MGETFVKHEKNVSFETQMGDTKHGILINSLGNSSH